MTVGFAWTWGPAIAALSVGAAAVGTWTVWRRISTREPRIRFAVALLRGAVLLLLGLMASDPTITRDTARKPLLRIVWDDAARLDVVDAPNGASRRSELSRAIADLSARGLDQRFEIGDAGVGRSPYATLFVSDGSGDGASIDRLDGRVVALVPARDPAVPDLSIVETRSPSEVVSGAAFQIAVTVRATRARGVRAVVTVADSAHVIASGAHEVSSDDDVATISLSGIAQAPGWQRLAIEVAAVSGERDVANNHFDTWLDVDTPQRRVLFLESEPSWEAKFIRRALEDDPTFRVDYVARISKAAELAQPTDAPKPAGADASHESAPTSVHAALADLSGLDAYDAVVLGPLDAAEIGAAEANRLESFVGSRGGGLVVLGGNAYGGSILSSRGALSTLLPAAIPASSLGPKERTGDEPKATVLMASSAEARHTSAFAALGEDPSAVLEKLQRLGPDYLKIGALKPAAVALAVDATAHGDQKPVLVAAQPYGTGSVVLVAPQDTWRLAVGAPPDLVAASARFWTGLVGWAAAGADPAMSVRFESGRCLVGTTARAELVARTPSFEPIRDTRIDAHCALVAPVDPTQSAAPIDVVFEPSPDMPGLYVAAIAPPVAGEWALTADCAGARSTASLQAIQPGDGDRSNRDPVRAAGFESAVHARNGDVVQSDHAEHVLDVLGAPSAERVVVTTHVARTAAWAFAIPLLFCVEIWLRRRYGID